MGRLLGCVAGEGDSFYTGNWDGVQSIFLWGLAGRTITGFQKLAQQWEGRNTLLHKGVTGLRLFGSLKGTSQVRTTHSNLMNKEV